MTLLRACLGALLSSFLALGAAAGVVSVPQRLAAYQAGLDSYRTTAAAAFLRDDAAMALLRSENPAMLGPLFLRAHETLDLAALPKQYEDPANLRRALIARDSEPTFANPDEVRAFYEGRDLTHAEMTKVVRALAEWRTLDAELRGWLGEAGASETAWRALGVDERSSKIVAVLREHILQGRTLALDGAAYRARLEEFARRAAPYMPAKSGYEMDQTLERHAELALDLRRARRAAKRAQDEGLSAVLGEASRAGDMDAASAVLARLEDDAKPASAPKKITKKTLASIAARLPEAVKRWAAGTPAAALLEQALGAIEIDRLPTSLGGYVNATDRLVVSREQLDRFLIERGRTATELLADDALLSEFALELAPVIVHEATHRLQRIHADASKLATFDAGLLYGHEDEREAFMAEELFVKAFAVKEPKRAAALAANERLAFWKPETIKKTIAALPYGYSDVPSAHGVRSRAVALAMYRAREGEKNPASIDSARLVRELDMFDRFNAYLDAMDARIRVLARALRGI